MSNVLLDALREGWQGPLCQGHCVRRTGPEWNFGGPQRLEGAYSGPGTQPRPSSSHIQEKKSLRAPTCFPTAKARTVSAVLQVCPIVVALLWCGPYGGEGIEVANLRQACHSGFGI